jgi:hypothetical protein
LFFDAVCKERLFQVAGAIIEINKLKVQDVRSTRPWNSMLVKQVGKISNFFKLVLFSCLSFFNNSLMRFFVFCFLLFFLKTLMVYAQRSPRPDSLSEIVSETPSLFDSLQQKKESLQALPTVLQDSLQLSQQLDSLRNLSQALDTLRIKQALDSLRQIPQLTQQAQVKVDSLEGMLDVSTRANAKIQALNQQLNQPLGESKQQLQGEINDAARLQGVSREGLTDLKEQTGLDINTQLPDVEGISLGVEGVDIPGVEVPGMELPELVIPETGLPSLELEVLPDVQGKLGEISKIGQETEAYAEDAVKLREGKLQEIENADKLAEEQFLLSEAGQTVQQELGGAEKGMGGLQKLAGREYAKGQAEGKVYEVATDHFAGHTEELKAAQDELNKYKGRFQKVESVKEMPRNWWKLNPLKDKPWQERLHLGSLWQFGRQEQFLIDAGPTVAWRFTDKFEAGGGYQWRLSIGKEKPWLNARDKVYGYHLFADYRFKKGFFGRVIYENLNTDVPHFNSKRELESTEQEWVKGLSVGIGKSYTFYKSLQGYSLVQYNVLHRHHKTPYTQPFQAKIGFYFNGKHLLKWKKGKE